MLFSVKLKQFDFDFIETFRFWRANSLTALIIMVASLHLWRFVSTSYLHITYCVCMYYMCTYLLESA